MDTRRKPDGSHPRVACELSSETEASRREELRRGLHAHVLEVEDAIDGYAFRFAWSAEQIEALGRFIAFESRCCPFMRFRLDVEPNRERVWLVMTGPPGTREFIGGDTGWPSRDESE